MSTLTGRLGSGVKSAIHGGALRRARGLAARVGRLLRFARRRMSRYFVVRLVIRTGQELSADDATHMAAGVAYYALFSLFPLLLGLSATMGYFVESQESRDELTGFVSSYLPGSGDLIAQNLDAVIELRGALGIFSVIGLLWSASAVFGAISKAVNRAWDVHQDLPIYVGKPRQMLMAMGVGLLFATSLGAAAVVRVATPGLTPGLDTGIPGLTFPSETVGRIVLQGVSFGLVLIIFLLLYKLLPNTKTYWQYIWPGALVGAALFELLKNLFLIYVNSFSNFEDVYGSLAPVIALLLWAYVSSFVLILGAELSSEYGRLKSNTQRGTLIHPRAGAPPGTGTTRGR